MEVSEQLDVKSFLLADTHEPHPVPIWRETFLGVDWVKLRASRVYYGIGVPKGDKSAVILVPGFLGYDYYMVELFAWLWRMRYRPYMSGIGHNAECPDILVGRLMKTVRKAYRKTGKRVHLVGHSLGGIISRGAAVLDPDLIASVTSLGSPLRGIRAHPSVLKLADRVRKRILSRRHERPLDKPIHDKCFTSECTCGFMNTWRDNFPDSVHETAVYTKTDGIVDWEVCKLDNPETDFEVKGTHCGLVWNPEVYKILANRLAEVDTSPLPKKKKSAA